MNSNLLTKLRNIILSLVVALFILTAAIAVPILNRGLYYNQVEKLGIPEKTGYSVEAIHEAFDEMMDYCTLGGEKAGQVFGTGSLKWSEEGKDHFDDVERLFGLDINLFKLSAMVVVMMLAWMIVKRERYVIAIGRGALFWGPVALASSLGIIGVLAATNFDRFFETFHHIFFPGKDNWIFYEDQDEIIKILPEKVFMNFAILILVLVIVLSAISIIADYLLARGMKEGSPQGVKGGEDLMEVPKENDSLEKAGEYAMENNPIKRVRIKRRIKRGKIKKKYKEKYKVNF